MDHGLRTPKEEFYASLTHGIGLILSIIGFLYLLQVDYIYKNLPTTISYVFYGMSLVGVYIASTLSHTYALRNINDLLRRIDQGFIYLLIVGTATPFAFVLHNKLIWHIFYTCILICGIVGFISKVVFAHQLTNLTLSLYIILGWGEAIGILPIYDKIPAESLYWLVTGGILYTIGIIFFVMDWRQYHFHTIWHLFVIAGSFSHFMSLLFLIISIEKKFL